MEAIGLVASIGGIIQLAVHGLTAARYLQHLYERVGSDASRDFVNGLVKSACLLQDIHDLGIRIQRHQNPTISKLRLASLQLNLEDCTRDLEQWHSIARRIEKQDLKRSTSIIVKRFGEGQERKPLEKFSRFVKDVFKESISSSGIEARSKIQQQFQLHHANVGTALAILQTDFHLIQIDTTEGMNTRLAALLDQGLERQEEERRRNSDLRNSNSSLLALSKSHDDRLRELQSVSSELSEKMNLVIRALSSQHSGSSSAISDSNHFKKIEQHGRKLSAQSTDLLPAIIDLPKETELIEDNQSSNDDEDMEKTLNRMFRLQQDFHKLAGLYFADLIAEYVAVVQEWKACCLHENVSSLMQRNEDNRMSQPKQYFTATSSELASRLLALRRRAVAESLNESLSEADAVLGLTNNEIDVWESSMVPNDQHGTQNKLRFEKSMLRTDAMESATRMNEWFLLVMLSTPLLTELHRTMVANTQVLSPYTTLGIGPQRVLTGEDWERQTIKFWLLDTGDSRDEGGYAASVFTESKESEMTILANELSWNDVTRPIDSDLGDDAAPLMRQALLPANFQRRVDTQTDVEAPPERASEECRQRAVAALERYRNEPLGHLAIQPT